MTATIDTETLDLLRDSMARFRDQKYTFEQRRRWLEKGVGYAPEAWRDYARFGWLALPLPSAHGGFDGDARAVATLMEYVGSALALEPVFASSILCGGLLAGCGDARAERWLGAIASGEAIFALAHAESADEGVSGPVLATYREGRLSGRKAVVLHGDVADQLIVSARTAAGALALCRVEPRSQGVAATRYRLVDGRGAASFEFRDAPAEPITAQDDVAALVERALDDARLALCSETYGAVCALNAITLEVLRVPSCCK